MEVLSEEKAIRELREAIRQNEALGNEVEIIRLVRRVPELEQVGTIAYLPPGSSVGGGGLLHDLATKRRAAEDELRMKANLPGRRFQNDPHAVLAPEPKVVWDDDPVRLAVNATDYVGVWVLSEARTIPVEIISACVVLLCAERRELYLHRRDPSSATFGSDSVGDQRPFLHTLGGGYAPPGLSEKEDDDLIETARREVEEETNIRFLRTDDTRMMLSKELKTGFIQLVLLGVNTTRAEVRRNKNSWEGKIVIVDFDRLPEKLFSSDEKWVPSGRAHVLAWLGLGAPPLGPEVKFDGYSARELFAKAMEELKG